MRAAVLVAHGPARKAFEMREMPDPVPGSGEVRVRVEMFGLNFADVHGRLGLYSALPPLPMVPGYDVVGSVDAVGPGVTRVAPGTRVVAMTFFGGYATLALAREEAVHALPGDFDGAAALALATQYVTAWHVSEELVRLFPGDHVLIHSAAGGVGTALVQMARRHQCIIYGLTTSPAKLDRLRAAGVDHPLCVTRENFDRQVRRVCPAGGLDVIFDPIGGRFARKGLGLLRSGGRLVCLGVSDFTIGRKSWPWILRSLAGLGLVHPAYLMQSSKGIIGVNMLRTAQERPQVVRRALEEVVSRALAGELTPVVGHVYDIEHLAEAHEALEQKKTVGKLAVRWQKVVTAA